MMQTVEQNKLKNINSLLMGLKIFHSLLSNIETGTETNKNMEKVS